MNRALVAAALSIITTVSFAQTRQLHPANTVRELLQVNGIENLERLPPEVGRMYIGNGNLRYYAMEGDDREFVFVGYVLPELPDGNNQPADHRIHVISADRTSGQLRYGVISPAEVPGAGSISTINRGKNYVYVTAHLNSSASNTFVLTRDLQLQREIYGYPAIVLASDTIVFQNSQIHFAPTHTTELSVYDPTRKLERKIYPPASSDRVRLDFVERVRAAYRLRGEDWFRINNHHMNPESFDSSIGVLRADEAGRTLAFHIVYENPINDAGDPLASRQDVVTTCVFLDDVSRTSCRERSLDAWTNVLGLSKSEILKESFAGPLMNELLRRAAANPNAVP
jgi:hypothetical protein